MKVTLSTLIYLIHLSFADDDTLVNLPEGIVRGKLETSKNGTEYYAFYQIPYAAPPVNGRRFKEPEDPEPWEGILDATESTKLCPQSAITPTSKVRDAIEGEDCLYLSVNSPMKTDVKLPVLVWIHGGGFTSGSISAYGPRYLMDHDIIVVQIQYRLGPFGFLTTMDGVIPANLGLKDQRKAINWVYSNIEHFGGDPNKITIMGESGGGMSVGYLLLDTSLDGKTVGAIQQSGSSAQRLTNIIHPVEYAISLGSLINNTINITSSEDLLYLLQKSSTEQIINAGLMVMETVAMSGLQSTGVLAELPWAIVIENDEVEKEPIITSPILESFKNGNFVKVPTMIGFNSEESLLWAMTATDATKDLAQKYEENPSLLADERFALTEENATSFGKEQLEQYDSFTESFGAFVKYSTDAGFINAILEQARLSSQHIPVYVYQFSYMGEILGNFIYQQLGGTRPYYPGAERVGHGEDLNYVWSSLYSSPDYDDVPVDDLLTRRRLLKLLTNFVKYQNPTPDEDEELENIVWPQVSTDDIEYLNINITLEIKSNLRNFKEISAIYEKYVGTNNVW